MTTLVSPQQTVGALVAEHSPRAKVFENHRIDYCCGGKLPLEEACQRRGVELQTVLEELAECDARANSTGSADWTTAPLNALIDNIVTTHHAYLTEELPRIAMLLEKAARVHGTNNPELVEMQGIFGEFRAELEEHALKEERILFPWIRLIESGRTNDAFAPGASIAQPIHCMETEHDDAGNALEKFRELSNGYVPPDHACNTWRVLYASLAALEADMHVHVHKENSILFPRAIEAEARTR
ncbi:MAG: regulator of cell morphosis and signaling [Candidatus Sumerlaeota bacterium]|nr:regulator of cell morphosis and signaling [Candidatus Sumerlaeota bacterium]